MDKPTGRLDNGQAQAAAGKATAESNVVPIAGTRRAQAAPDQERRLSGLLDALPTAVYTTDSAGRITYYNEAATALWGRRPTLGTTKWSGAWKLYWPDGTPMAPKDSPMALAVKERRPVRDMEVTAERPDGTRVPVLPSPTPLFDETGKLTGAVNMLLDISERKQAEDRETLLIRELHHRVKNTLATVQAIMGATARASTTIDDFKTALIGRIGALARTHLLIADEYRVVSFADLLHGELDAFDDGQGRITLSGPPVTLANQLAISIGMAVHELTTNAAKYGALSLAGGKVEVQWRLTIEANGRTLDFDWTESSGPAVTAPARSGFGTRLLDLILPGQIHAVARTHYAPDGARVHLTVPLPAEEPS
jgi:PAS domain S-box-containing protein